MKSIYENVSENETTVSIIKSELNLSKDIVRSIIKRMNLIVLNWFNIMLYNFVKIVNDFYTNFGIDFKHLTIYYKLENIRWI